MSQTRRFWVCLLLVFGAMRLADALNAVTGLWVVPSRLPAQTLGALLPLTQFGAVLALPVSVLTTVFARHLGAYAAAMGGVDIIVFTAGVGENQSGMRAGVCEGMEWMGVKLDAEANLRTHGEEAVISAPDSRVKVVVIPTDEELMIATDTMNLL